MQQTVKYLCIALIIILISNCNTSSQKGSNITKQKKDLQKLADSLKYVDNIVDLDYYPNKDFLYKRIVKSSHEVVPFLIKKLDDTITTKCIGPYNYYQVGDIAFFAIEEIVNHKINVDSILISIDSTLLNKNIEGLTRYHYFFTNIDKESLQKKRLLFKNKIAKWYEKNY